MIDVIMIANYYR